MHLFASSMPNFSQGQKLWQQWETRYLWTRHCLGLFMTDIFLLHLDRTTLFWRWNTTAPPAGRTQTVPSATPLSSSTWWRRRAPQRTAPLWSTMSKTFTVWSTFKLSSKNQYSFDYLRGFFQCGRSHGRNVLRSDVSDSPAGGRRFGRCLPSGQADEPHETRNLWRHRKSSVSQYADDMLLFICSNTIVFPKEALAVSYTLPL